MTEQAPAQQVPTFKLVLVGDGGTGKVREDLIGSRWSSVPGGGGGRIDAGRFT